MKVEAFNILFNNIFSTLSDVGLVSNPVDFADSQPSGIQQIESLEGSGSAPSFDQSVQVTTNKKAFFRVNGHKFEANNYYNAQRTRSAIWGKLKLRRPRSHKIDPMNLNSTFLGFLDLFGPKKVQKVAKIGLYKFPSNRTSGTLCNAQKLCQSVHPAAQLAQPANQNEWQALIKSDFADYHANNDTLDSYFLNWIEAAYYFQVGPKDSNFLAFWKRSGQVISSAYTNRFSEEKPCLVLKRFEKRDKNDVDSNNGYGSYNYFLEGRDCNERSYKNYGSFCEIDLEQDNDKVDLQTLSLPNQNLKNCYFYDHMVDRSVWQSVPAADLSENTNCLYYASFNASAVTYFEAESYCQSLHPDATLAEFRSEAEWNALINFRYQLENLSYTHWIAKAIDAVNLTHTAEDHSIAVVRKFSSGYVIPTERFRIASHTMIEGAFSIAHAIHDRNYINIDRCEHDDCQLFKAQALCEIRA